MTVPSPSGLQAEKHLLGRWLAQARRQGLLASVPPEAWHTLCAVLSFTCRDGGRRFTAEQLALALAVPRPEADRRLADLAGTQWRGQPLAVPQLSPESEAVGAEVAAADLLLGIGDDPVRSGSPPSAPDAGDFALGRPSPDGGADPALARELEAVGLRPEQVQRLLTHFPAERVRRQLAWLPQRGARNPAAFLMKAVANDWEAPKGAGEEAR